MQANLGRDWLLVGIGYACKKWHFSAIGFLIEPFNIASPEFVGRALAMDFHKDAPLSYNQLPRLLTKRSIRRNGCGNGDDSMPIQEHAELRDPTDIDVAINFGKRQLRAELRSHLVTIEHLHTPALRAQRAGQSLRQRGLSGAGQTREPDRMTKAQVRFLRCT